MRNFGTSSLFLGLSSVLGSAALVTSAGCGGDDAPSADAAPQGDAPLPGPADAATGVVCENALATYGATLGAPSAEDDGTDLSFVAQLDNSNDGLRIVVSTGEAPRQDIALPDAAWQVGICVDQTDGSCDTELPAYSGTLSVTSVEGRFQASLSQVIFADDIAAPTCSAALGQATIDVAILGPI